jgi:hypothetical protein
MRSFFIGATPELADIRYLAIPTNPTSIPEEGNNNNAQENEQRPPQVLNKFGFTTLSSGTLHVILNTVIIGG